MEYVTNRGQRIAYDVAGGGEDAVVLLTGLGTLRGCWADAGYVDGLTDSFTVITIDSLGHGDSDAPSDCSLYSPAQRAGDVVAVLDVAGFDRAHVVGYSMGGWIATAVLMHAPERLHSMCSGGWDPVHGMPGLRARFGTDLNFAAVMGGFREGYPELTKWITPDRELALRCCFSALDDLDGVERALETTDRPLLLWDGQDDPHHDSSCELASRMPNVKFLETPGDHATAFFDHSSEAIAGLRSFFASTAD